MAADFADVQQSFSEQRPNYEHLAKTLGEALKERLAARGLDTIVLWRAKDILSFAKKALRKGYADPIAEIGDKAGVRVIVHYAGDVPVVEEIVSSLAIVHSRDSKLDAMDYDRLGYLGVHYDVTLQSDLTNGDDARLAGLHAELQIHTKAQSAWAVVSHELLYKSSTELPVDVLRGITRLVALVELFDDEVTRLRQTIEDHPDYKDLRILEPLDNELITLTSMRPDRALSALSIPAIMRMYDKGADAILRENVHPFLNENRDKLTAIYQRYESDARANPLLFQPEALLIFERFENDIDRVRDVWPSDVLPMTLLENLATVWGVELSDTADG
ncbi:MAG: hypothetical protein JWN65_2724 [Solirubrobacterales bacterium]|nr:hypothetical protein [Solirubrobacterales bacterium]